MNPADQFLREVVGGAAVQPPGGITPSHRIVTTPQGGVNEARTAEQSVHLAAEQAIRLGQDRAKVNASLVESGYAPLPGGGPASPPPSSTAASSTAAPPAAAPTPEDAAAAEEAAAEAAFALPPAQAHEFRLPSLASPGEQVSDQELKQRDTLSRNWLVAAGMAAPLGNSITRDIATINSQWGAANDGAEAARAENPAYKSWATGQRAQLDRLWGAEAPARIEQARQFVKSIEQKSPGLVAMLNRSGAGDAASVIVQIFNQSKRAR